MSPALFVLNITLASWVGWSTPIIAALRRQRKEDPKFSLGFVVRLCLKNKTKQEKKKTQRLVKFQFSRENWNFKKICVC
jgi:hypothetical protein